MALANSTLTVTPLAAILATDGSPIHDLSLIQYTFVLFCGRSSFRNHPPALGKSTLYIILLVQISSNLPLPDHEFAFNSETLFSRAFCSSHVRSAHDHKVDQSAEKRCCSPTIKTVLNRWQLRSLSRYKSSNALNVVGKRLPFSTVGAGISLQRPHDVHLTLC